MYKCLCCNKYFQNKRRNIRTNNKLFNEYVWQRQTYSDLAKKYKKSTKWVQRKLDEVTVKSELKIEKKEVVIVADTTFFSRLNGLCVFRDSNLKKNIWWRFVDYERVRDYEKGRKHLEKNGFIIKAVILDGRRGVREVFQDIPVQMCHFHQIQIIRRYLTSNPKLEASIKLKQIASTLIHTTEDVLKERVDMWHDKWKDWLKEKTTNPETGKWFYTHKKVRSAFRSLKTNLPFLFTCLKYPELKIPNTTNSLDGYFNVLKSKLNVHRGLNKRRSKKVIIELLKNKKSLK